MYDLVGDIHGHADALETLLKHYGYEAHGRGFRHPERTLIFLGDLIDRGPQIKRTVEIARSMVDAGDALIIMGNHEFNALCYHTADSEKLGEYLRPHTGHNTNQHQATLAAFSRPGEMEELLNWIYTIPLWLELPEFRAVHACWDADALQLLLQHFPETRLQPDLLAACARKDGAFYSPLETILKGPEAPLPSGADFRDSDGNERRSIRIKWFLPSAGQTYRSYSFPERSAAPDEPLTSLALAGYPADAPPVFFGHYSRKEPHPAPVTPNCFCLDYNVVHGGFLCGYRWGEGFMWCP